MALTKGLQIAACTVGERNVVGIGGTPRLHLAIQEHVTLPTAVRSIDVFNQLGDTRHIVCLHDLAASSSHLAATPLTCLLLPRLTWSTTRRGAFRTITNNLLGRAVSIEVLAAQGAKSSGRTAEVLLTQLQVGELLRQCRGQPGGPLQRGLGDAQHRLPGAAVLTPAPRRHHHQRIGRRCCRPPQSG